MFIRIMSGELLLCCILSVSMAVLGLVESDKLRRKLLLQLGMGCSIAWFFLTYMFWRLSGQPLSVFSVAFNDLSWMLMFASIIDVFAINGLCDIEDGSMIINFLSSTAPMSMKKFLSVAIILSIYWAGSISGKGFLGGIAACAMAVMLHLHMEVFPKLKAT